jgi:hypothetical protein
VTPRPRRRISSRWTLFHKVIFPIAWIGIFLVATTVMLLAPAETSHEFRSMRWLLVAITIVGAWLILRLALPLKHVEVGDASFFVSDRSREIEIPFRDVARVTGSRFVNPPRVTLHLRTPCEFGDRVVFLPRLRLVSGWKAHPVVKELERRMADAVDR